MGDPKAKTTEAGEGDGALARLRTEIDAVDRTILAELNKRAELVKRVGDLKRSERATVFRAARERDLVDALVRSNTGAFPASGIRTVFREIIFATRSLEQKLRIAFLGPIGTFSHAAARNTFGEQAEFVPVATIADVIAAVERHEADHGLVPVENSTDGVVTQTLDALLDSRLALCGETVLRVSHCLLSQSGRLEDVKRVASHPQPLAQCRHWLDRHLAGVERAETASTVVATALAARLLPAPERFSTTTGWPSRAVTNPMTASMSALSSPMGRHTRQCSPRNSSTLTARTPSRMSASRKQRLRPWGSNCWGKGAWVRFGRRSTRGSSGWWRSSCCRRSGCRR